ncbi:hypothetical protein C823_006283 [Eubacterium plexicaudatum ASF492]|uniref:Uncharacterized protein n=1 Tax=Eubacterium plexicaudatum ASF492 TaxID=1235802 RepID=N2AJR5_9FIRM|nr:hypothetical protein C823_006283 [Eubacterium plexicaudatum ASF492]
MMADKNMSINISGGQYNSARGNAIINAVQYNNVANASELDHALF